MASSVWTAPTVQQVADVMPARLARDGQRGQRATTFQADTKPTGVQVQRIIDTVAVTVRSKIGATIPEVTVTLPVVTFDEQGTPTTADTEVKTLHEAARTVVVWGAAAAVEQGGYPEQTRTDQSPRPWYQKLYEDGLAALVVSVREAGAGGDPGSEDDTTLAAHTFNCWPPLAADLPW